MRGGTAFSEGKVEVNADGTFYKKVEVDYDKVILINAGFANDAEAQKKNRLSTNL